MHLVYESSLANKRMQPDKVPATRPFLSLNRTLNGGFAHFRVIHN